ncbi:MAG: DUF885 family protein [Dermatophilaceae bacterium]
MSTHQQDATPVRPTTAVDALADRYVDAATRLSPLEATYIGIPGFDDQMDDLSPAGLAEVSALRQRTLAELAAATPVDDVDRITIAAMTERLTLAEQMYAVGLDHMNLNVLASPSQTVRDIFDLMAQDSDDAWSTFTTRMAKVPGALAGYTESLAARPRRRQCRTAPTGPGRHRAVPRPRRRGRLFHDPRGQCPLGRH